MADKRLDARPIDNGSSIDGAVRRQPEGPAKNAAWACVDTHDPPHPISLLERDVCGADKVTGFDIDELMGKNVVVQQYFTFPTFEPSQVDGLDCQAHSSGRKFPDLIDGNEDMAATYSPAQAGDRRIAACTKSDDKVIDAPQILA
ncbi:MAG: hypothetical protein NVSMB22_20160 [Chloroflexota bacterium]